MMTIPCATRCVRTSMRALLLVVGVARAQEASEIDLRKEVQNPVGALTTVSIVNTINMDASRLTSYVLQTQAVTPVRLSERWLLVPRLVVNAPRYQAGSGAHGTAGFGDTTPRFFISPAHVGRVIWVPG